MTSGRVGSEYPPQFIENDVSWNTVPSRTSMRTTIYTKKYLSEASIDADAETCLLMLDVGKGPLLGSTFWHVVLGLTKIANFAISCNWRVFAY